MKKYLRIVLFTIACCTTASNMYAQSVPKPSDTGAHKPMQVRQAPTAKGPKGISHELSVGIRLNTNGWSAFTDLGKVKPLDMKRRDMFYKVRLFQLEVTEKKDPREEKINAIVASTGNGSPKYIYGKINNFYAVKLGIGTMRMIAGKPDPGAVSIHWLNAIGVSLGMQKPYYVDVGAVPVKYSEATATNFLDKRQIEGSAGFSKGLSEMVFIPGGHFKSALHFDFSANRKNVIGVEAGVNVEYYSQPVVLMANQSGTPYFVDMYVSFQFGRRW
jgi:hypothetical protein